MHAQARRPASGNRTALGEIDVAAYRRRAPGVRIQAVVVSLVLLSPGCAGENDRGEALDQRPTASRETIAGVIFRDDETKADIAATAGVALPNHDAELSPLSLVVTKSRYRLDVLHRGERIKTYPIALGDSPVGAKRVQGDERTPEGEYRLYPHHPSPSFGSSFYVAYPNAEDARRGFEEGRIDAAQQARILDALRRDLKPPHATRLGGLILIHGRKERWIPWLTRTNWTDGCIAMENDHLLELLAAFDRDDRPTVLIRP